MILIDFDDVGLLMKELCRAAKASTHSNESFY